MHQTKSKSSAINLGSRRANDIRANDYGRKPHVNRLTPSLHQEKVASNINNLYNLEDVKADAKKLIDLLNAANKLVNAEPNLVPILTGHALRKFFNQVSGRLKVTARLPTIAPEVWSERPRGHPETCVEFIKRVYDPWLGRGITRAYIRDLDESLIRTFDVFVVRNGQPADLNLPAMKTSPKRRLASLGQ
ncbi:MAG: hypothetical protein QOI12_157 [Alphaproteobacteria bacterium]|jgi:hypothetical protein|nr:hypothetical protein [Alphaproteobacteria bacterium]